MNTSALRILVADDDKSYCVMIKRSITNHGHSVIICNSGEETLNRLQKEQYDVILLDYKMEGTNGINVLQWMYGKKIETPVILITGHGADEIHEEAFKWGAAEYFIKGEMDSVRLPVLIEQIHRRYRARNSNTKYFL